MTGIQIGYTLVAAAGIAGAWAGLYWAHRLPRPYDALAALGSVLGAALFLIGSLLSRIPDFFAR